MEFGFEIIGGDGEDVPPELKEALETLTKHALKKMGEAPPATPQQRELAIANFLMMAGVIDQHSPDEDGSESAVARQTAFASLTALGVPPTEVMAVIHRLPQLHEEALSQGEHDPNCEHHRDHLPSHEQLSAEDQEAAKALLESVFGPPDED